MQQLVRDFKHALRMFRNSPGFTATVIAVLALGIGANTAVFSVLSAVMLRPLPFANPEDLVVLWDDFTAVGGPADVNPAPANYVDWKARSRSFEDMALMESRTYNLTGKGAPEKLTGIRTTANLFSLLGLQPLLGRTFAADDVGPDASPVVVISRSLWRRRFGGDPSLIGRTIVLDGVKRFVVGVVPDDFRFPDAGATLWVPTSFTPQELALRTANTMDVVARLKRGVSVGQAQAEMTVLAKVLQRDGLLAKGTGISVAPLHAQLASNVRPALFLLLTAVGLVLLITCANVANLLLARGTSRKRELALRQALGAGQGRMLRQLFTESALLGALGLAASIALSTVSFGYLARLVPGDLPQGTHPVLDWRVLTFTAGITMFTVVLFGIGPALVATKRIGFGEVLKKGGIGLSSGASGNRVRKTLVSAEITLTVVLLVCAGLLLRSYVAALDVDPGFRPDHLLLAETDLSMTKYSDFAARSAFYARVLARVRALPGVTNAGYVNFPPLVFNGGRTLVSIEGQPPPSSKDMFQYIPADRVVSQRYFATLGVPLIRGRSFDERDAANATPTVLINRTMSHRYWPNTDPIGKRFRMGGSNGKFSHWLTVVGVVGDVPDMGLDAPIEPEFYLPSTQAIIAGAPYFWPKYLVVRTERDPMTLATVVRKAIWAVDPDQPVSSIRPMSEVFGHSLSARNTQLTLVGGLALLALLLASVGLYGVLSYTVAQRTAEIGLRMALGAQRGEVIRSIVRSALFLALLGLAAGLAAAFALSEMLASFLFGISPADPATYISVPVVLVLVTVLASYLPARRAANVDPVIALREE